MSPLTSFSVAATFCLAALHLPPSQAASKSDYISNALNATNVLTQTWYDSATGRFQGLWWNSANAITTIAGLVALDTDAFMSSANYFWRNTLVAAPASNGGSFANDFYDDEGWWALAWLRVYDVTQNSTYLDTAKDIFADMKQDDKYVKRSSIHLSSTNISCCRTDCCGIVLVLHAAAIGGPRSKSRITQSSTSSM